MDIAVLGSEHFVAGFRLAGIQKTFISDGKAQERVHRALEDKDIGILIMNAQEYDTLDEKTKDRVMTNVQPTVIVLSHDVSAEESLRTMIIRALGIDLWGKNV